MLNGRTAPLALNGDWLRRWRRIFAAPCIVLLVIGWAELAAQTPTSGSEVSDQKKRELPVFGQAQGRFYGACERMVSLLLSFPVTTGDIEDGCVCSNNAIESAALPEAYRKDIVRTVDGQEYLYFAGMGALTSGSGSLPRELTQAATEMYDNVRLCLAPMPLIDRAYASGKISATPEKMVALGTDVIPIPGPARSHFRGVGGLQKMRLGTVMEAVYGTFFSSQAAQPPEVRRTMKDEYGLDQFDYGLMIRSIDDANVLDCKYRRSNRRVISHSYYFWYEIVPAGLNNELRSGLPRQHPIFAIGEARPWCPDREPAK